MHPDLSPHLHSPECNALIRELHKCHEDHPMKKYLGKCSEIDSKLWRCLVKEVDFKGFHDSINFSNSKT